MAKLTITYDRDVVDEIAAAFQLRAHNARALHNLVETLAGDYGPAVQQVLDMATGAGKTYLMAAFIEYLRRQGVYQVLIVTPGLVVQDKTVRNFQRGNPKYIPGAEVPALVATPTNLSVLATTQSVMGAEPSRLYVFNIQQLIAPAENGEKVSAETNATRMGLRKDNEVVGNVFAQLQALDDLVIIADESHMYGESAVAFSAALRELDPAACIGLTASAKKGDHVIFRYPLFQAIEDQCVKTPVLAYRKDGYPPGDEEAQLRDALTLLGIKAEHYSSWAKTAGLTAVNPVLFVTCSDVPHASEIETLLSGPDYLGDPAKVLRVDNTTSKDAAVIERLENLDSPGSPVRAVVSVNKLKEGWDVKNIAVLCALRVSKSQVLTQQTMGRGLRLPFGAYTGIGHVDQLDIITHGSYRDLLRDENVLTEFGLDGAMRSDQTPKPVPPSGGTTPPSTTGTGTPQVGPGGLEPSSETTGGTGTGTAPSGSSTGHTAPETVTPTETTSDPKPQVSTRDVGEAIEAGTQLHTVDVEVHSKYAQTTFVFPASRMEYDSAEFTLAKVDKETLRKAAQKVSDGGELIEREAIQLRSKAARKLLGTTPVEQATGAAAAVAVDEVRKVLITEVSTTAAIPRTDANLTILDSSTVPIFVGAVSIPWTTKSLLSAIDVLRKTLSQEAARFERERSTTVIPMPVELPIDKVVHYPAGTERLARVDSGKEFVVRGLYEPWERSLFPAVPFDSYSAEYKLAELVDKSAAVDWWKRLVPKDGAKIAYTVRDNYFPDFVVYDSGDDIHWIVEGKAKDKRGDAAVEAKKKATDELVTEVLGDPRFAGARWGYFIAYEDDIAAAGSWAELKQKADLVGNPRQEPVHG